MTVDDRDQLLFLGKECHHPSCHLNDFLPFSCPACHLDYCQPHFLPSAHSCSAPLPASMVDRIAPQCPLCLEIVPYHGGGSGSSKLDPNEAVERHILSGTCVGMEGGEDRKKQLQRLRREKGEICWKKGCGKVLVAPIKCPSCVHVFCPSHRHSASHSCASTPSSSRPPTPQAHAAPAAAARGALSRLATPLLHAKPSTISSNSLPAPAPTPVKTAVAAASPSPLDAAGARPTPLEARAAAAAAALKRAGQDAKVPFVKSKTDKRAQEEAASALKALKMRHDKGILSKAEEVRFAELQGQAEAARRRTGDKDGCIVA